MEIENMKSEQQASIMRIRRMKRLFDKMEDEIIDLLNTPNCKCGDKVDLFDLEDKRLYECDGSCSNYTLSEAIEKVEKFIDFNLEKEYKL